MRCEATGLPKELAKGSACSGSGLGLGLGLGLGYGLGLGLGLGLGVLVELLLERVVAVEAPQRRVVAFGGEVAGDPPVAPG